MGRASRAASSSPKCRFKVSFGSKLLEEAQVKKWCSTPHDIPIGTRFDAWHHDSTEALVGLAMPVLGVSFKYGVAAKLLNVYMKALFIGSYDDGSKLKSLHASLHPPIDRLLLKELARKKNPSEKLEEKEDRAFWRGAAPRGWSNLDHSDYIKIIQQIRKNYPEGLWRVEENWIGFQ